MFYGWVVVGVTFLTQFISSAFIFYTFGIVLKDFAETFGAGRLGVSGIHFVMPWAGALIAPLVGRAAGRGHLRALLTAGVVCAGLGFCAISQASALWQLYVVYPVLMAFAAATLSGVGASTLVVNWFARTRATALGISQIGASAGGMIMAPLTVSLFAEHGWRDVYLGFGITILAIAPLVAWLTVGRPEERGLRADGERLPPDGAATATNTAAATAAHAAGPAALSARAALAEPNLWKIAFITGVGFMLSGATVTHLVAMATDLGVEPGRASRLLTILATGALLGKVVFGRLADRAGEKAAYAVAIGIEIVALAALSFAPRIELLEPIAAVFGLGIGGNLPLSTALLARAFGSAAFGSMMGMKIVLLTPLVAVGTPFAGWVFDETGSYSAAFAVFLALVALSLWTLATVRLVDPPAKSAPDPASA